jgi:hypothetical protein
MFSIFKHERKNPYNSYGRGTKAGLRHTKYMGEFVTGIDGHQNTKIRLGI